MHDNQRLDTLRVAAEAKARACLTVGEVIAEQIQALEGVERTAGTRAMLTGLLALLKAEHASAKSTMADVLSVVASQPA